jgi:hypothetical protein
MAGRMQTHAIRLTVDGGGQIKAEPVSVGHSGEQSPNRHPLSEAGTLRLCQASSRHVGPWRKADPAPGIAVHAHDDAQAT